MELPADRLFGHVAKIDLLGKNYYQSITKPIRSRSSPCGDQFYND